MRTKHNIPAPLTVHGITSVIAHTGLVLLMLTSYWLSQKSTVDGDPRFVLYSPVELFTFIERSEQSAIQVVQGLQATDSITASQTSISKEIAGTAQAAEIKEAINATALIEPTEAKEKIEAKDTTVAKDTMVANEITEPTTLTKATKQRIATEVATSLAKKIAASSSEPMAISNDKMKQSALLPASMTQQTARPDHAHNPKPDYPVALRDRGLSGVVWLRVWVDANGRPKEIELAKGSGYRLFDESALRAVQQWRFIPAKNDHQSLASWVEFAVRFVING